MIHVTSLNTSGHRCMRLRVRATMGQFDHEASAFRRLCPELQELDLPMRARIVDLVRSEVRRDVLVVLSTVLLDVAVGAMVVWLGIVIPSGNSSGEISSLATLVKCITIAMLTVAAFVAVRRLVYGVLFRRRTVRRVRRAVNTMSAIKLCENCGYNLRGIDSVYCPECGSGTSMAKARQ